MWRRRSEPGIRSGRLHTPSFSGRVPSPTPVKELAPFDGEAGDVDQHDSRNEEQINTNRLSVKEEILYENEVSLYSFLSYWGPYPKFGVTQS